MSSPKVRTIFREGEIPPEFVMESIAKHAHNTEIGAHSIFLGQVRADAIRGKTVRSIVYTSDEELALGIMHRIRQEIFAEFALTCAHVYHSLGDVQAGKLCLFVFTSSPRRGAATAACSRFVERIKAELPIWGKELFDDDSHQWKENTPP